MSGWDDDDDGDDAFSRDLAVMPSVMGHGKVEIIIIWPPSQVRSLEVKLAIARGDEDGAVR